MHMSMLPYVCVYVYVYVYAYVYVYMHVCVYMYICTHACMLACMYYTCIHICFYVSEMCIEKLQSWRIDFFCGFGVQNVLGFPSCFRDFGTSMFGPGTSS